MIKLADCPVCLSTEWLDASHLRDSRLWRANNFIGWDDKIVFKMCAKCGFITYDYIEEDRLKYLYKDQRYYIKEADIDTTKRKLVFHKKFISEFIRPEFEILDIGCGIGYLLNWIGNSFNVPRSALYGTEYSTACRNYAKHIYGLENVTNDDIPDKQFDMIILYQVFEHIQYPAAKLKAYKDILKDDGLLYISLPYVLPDLEKKGSNDIDNFDGYYHLNHVNNFTIENFRIFLQRIGFKPIKEDLRTYGMTFMCKKTEPESINTDHINTANMFKMLELQHKAAGLFEEKKYDDALKVFPYFPEALIKAYFRDKNPPKYVEAANQMIELCPYSARARFFKGLIYTTIYNSKRDKDGAENKEYYIHFLDMAEQQFLEYENMSPTNENVYLTLAEIYHEKRDFSKRDNYILIYKDMMGEKDKEFLKTFNYLYG